MKKLIAISVIAILLYGCQKWDTPNREIITSPEPTFEEDFNETYNELNFDRSHPFNMAIRATVNVTTPYPEQVTVYAHLCNRWYQLATADCDNSTILTFDAPIGEDDFTIVAGDKAQRCKNGSSVDFSANGETVPAGIADAQPLGWIVAMECTSSSCDFDFNDVVLRVVPRPDGSLSVTSMACGTVDDVWLHYVNGDDDYVLSPYAFNGYSIFSNMIDPHTAYIYELHNWFSDDYISVYSGYGVNVLSGYNNRPSREVVIPKEVFGIEGTPSMAYISYCEQSTTDKGKLYLVPKRGLYVTNQEYNQKLMTDEEKRFMVFGAWPPGHSPVLLVFPDICEDDTPEQHIGWQWPTENSRIDMVYPAFTKWLNDPAEHWYSESPSGWSDRTGIRDSYGAYLYYGYYKR